MGILIKPPMTVNVTASGITNLLPPLLSPKFRYKIYAMQLVSTKTTRVITLLEDSIPRWSGELQDGDHIRIDFGSTGWELQSNAQLDILTSGKLDININFLQWGIVTTGA